MRQLDRVTNGKTFLGLFPVDLPVNYRINGSFEEVTGTAVQFHGEITTGMQEFTLGSTS